MKNKLKKFTNKRVLLTGASSGIGEAMAYALAKAGARLCLADINSEKLAVVCDRCEVIRKTDLTVDVSQSGELNGAPQGFTVDFSDTASIDVFASEIKKANATFDYLILNAGISQRALALETDFEVDRKIMDVNYFGAVYLVKKLSETFLSGRAFHIAVTTSISGLFGFPMRSAYCASKHALFGFFESLALEYENIKVTFLIPGRINTPISKSALLGDGAHYARMDDGQATGMDVDKCVDVALRAIAKGKRRKLIGGKELLMVYFKKFAPFIFYKLARKISAT
jgi:NAD(P)-dependent dehydrogenase (short-subunit alcohol dehydrogenase family)